MGLSRDQSRSAAFHEGARPDLTLQTSTEALQAAIDALHELKTLDQIVPRVLDVAANHFKATSCAFYTNDPSGEVWLRYWHVDGRTMLPDELLNLDPHRFALIRMLAAGFTVPDSYLGQPTQHVLHSVVLNHMTGTSVPEFDRFAVETGWDLELNIGVAATGVRASSLCIYRGHEHPYTPEEIALAESLAKQLGLAMHFVRLAEKAQDAALAAEKAVAAVRTAAELARTTAAMQALIDALATMSKLEDFVPVALRIAADTFGSEQALFYTHPKTEPIRLGYWLRGDEVLTASEILALERPDVAILKTLAGGFEVPDSHLGTPPRLRKRAVIVDHEAGSAAPEFDGFCRSNRMDVELNVPLVVGDAAEGAVLFFRRAGETFSEDEIALAEALGKQIAIAMQARRIAEVEKQATLAAEREAIAERRARAFAGASRALQATIGAVGEALDLSDIIPRVLTIAAETFGAVSCSLFDVDPSGVIRLLYWNVEGRTYTPSELSHIDPEKYGLVRRLAEGFEAPDDYLGMPTTRVGTALLDHVQGTTVPEFDAFAAGAGWDLELNIGVGAGGLRSSTLVIYRGRSQPFTPEEIALAESLATQLGLALEFAKLAEQARQTAVAREREEAARSRAAELAGANKVLQSTLGRFAVSSDTGTFLSSILEEIARQIGARDAQLALYDESTHTLRTAAELSLEATGSFDFPSVISASELGAFEILRSMREPRFFDPDTEAHLFWPGTVEYHRRRGTKSIFTVSMLFGSRFSGYLGFGFPRHVCLSPERIELIQALAQQATLVTELLRLSNLERESALAREREVTARQRADQLAAANKAIRQGAAMMATARDENEILGAMLSQAIDATGANAAAVMRRVVPGECRVTLAALSQAGIGLDIAAMKSLPCFVELERLSDSDPAGYFQGLLRGNLNSRVCDESLRSWAPETAAYHARGGHKIVWDYPFFDEKEVGGWISLAFKDQRTLDDTTLQMLATLTSQVSLALRMGRLSMLAQETAVLTERARVAGDIHDSLAQSFAGISMQLEAAEDALVNGETTQALSTVALARDISRFGLSEARRSIMTMRPAQFLQKGLVHALTMLAERSSIRDLLECTFEVNGQTRQLDGAMELEFFRIAQEAVSNAVRHGRPGKIAIDLDFDPAAVTLRVRDNGKGMLPAKAEVSSGGLSSIRQRAERMKGTFDLVSSPGSGATVSVMVDIGEVHR